MKFRFLFAGMQILLLAVANYIDLREHNGMGEGMNQVYANSVSNFEFLFKELIDLDGIVIYDFNLLFARLSIGTWYLIGWGIDRLGKR